MTTWQSVAQQADRLGESPFWHPGEQRLYWIDIPGRQLRRTDPAGGPAQSWALPQEPGCIAPARSGGWVIALRDGIYRARAWGGPLALLQRFGYDPATTRFNDGKADPLGRFWAGTLFEPKTQAAGELFSLDCRPDNGAGGAPLAERKAGGLVTANGLAWSPDGRHAVLGRHARPSHPRLGLGRAHQRAGQRAGVPPVRRQASRLATGPARLRRPARRRRGRRAGPLLVRDVRGPAHRAALAGRRRASTARDARCCVPPCPASAAPTCARCSSPAPAIAARRSWPRCPLSGHVVCTRVDTPGLPVNFFID